MVPTTLPIIVYRRKDIETSTVIALVQSAQVSGKEKEKENDKDETNGEKKNEKEENEGTQEQIRQDVTPAPTTQDQGTTKNVEQEEDRTEKLRLTTKYEEKLAIQTLVTLPGTATRPSQGLQRPSIEVIPLQSSSSSPSTSKVDEVTSFGDVNLDKVIELPKFYLETITIE